jgi:hypothetical protein
MIRISFLLALLFMATVQLGAQPDRWQQRAYYEMDIDIDVNTHRFTGHQKLIYFNNSPDQLDKVFYHLYFNAFQPGSMMDVRSRTIADPDGRVANRINQLSEDEIGYHKITSLKCNGKDVKYEVVGTILEVMLNKPIMPGESAEFEMEFNSQVPVQIRRSGRNNREGIDYSMAQWYPKMAEYDYQGWHANPYIGREFYGIWGDFDVKITIDSDWTIGGTGYLQNKEEIGHGYAQAEMKKLPPKNGDKHTWHFKAYNVHDFMWAADPEYMHIEKERADGTILHFFYKETERTKETWPQLPDIMDKAFDFIEEHYGDYPYDQYTFIQGGDGGMEYPMGTLITGERSLGSLVGVSIHELMHTWYQMLMGTNESLYSWMDEGFTSYADTETSNWLRKEGVLQGTYRENPHVGTFSSFARWQLSGREEPLSTHSDHYVTNSAYSRGAYTKGSVFLQQLKYVIGKDNVDEGLLKYYNAWRFKHPNDNDFIRIMEKQSGLELDWYKEYMVNTTHRIDYAVKSVEGSGSKTTITMEKRGVFPMPIDVQVNMKDGSSRLFNIPLRIMRGHKPLGDMTLLEDWPWTHPEYSFELDMDAADIQSVVIDPNIGMVDVDRENNTFEVE